MGQPAFRRAITDKIERGGGPIAAVWRHVDPIHHGLSRAVDRVEGVHALAYDVTVPRVLGAIGVSPGLIDVASTTHRRVTRGLYDGLRTVHWYV